MYQLTQNMIIVRKALSSFIILTFAFSLILPPQAYAQGVAIAQPTLLQGTAASRTAVGIQSLNLPEPGSRLEPSTAFVPPMMTGITLYEDNPFQFDFIIHPGDDELQGEALEAEAGKLINYFLATLTVPQEEMWVNLSPYEENRIIAEGLSQTEMGRDMLAQDYILKQLSASLLYPEDDLGNEFWTRVYAKAEQIYGTTDIPTNTFNKIWIVPEEAVIYVHEKSVFVASSHLKVMLEEDYLALEMNQDNSKHGLGSLTDEDLEVISGVSEEIVREILIPEIEREVNEGKNFAGLRQMYNAMILATWYKTNLENNVLTQKYANQNKISGIELKDEHITQDIYAQYVEAFKQGVYDYIKEDYDPVTQETVPRKYFSGGMDITDLAMKTVDAPDQAVPDLVELALEYPHYSVSTVLNHPRWGTKTAMAALGAGLLTSWLNSTNPELTPLVYSADLIKREAVEMLVKAEPTFNVIQPKKESVPENSWAPTAYFLGVEHEVRGRYADFERTLAESGKNGKPAIVGFEGVIRNKAHEKGYFKDKYQLERDLDFVFGIEDAFAQGYAELLITYGIVTLPKLKHLANERKSELIHDAVHNPDFARRWKRLGEEGDNQLSDGAERLYRKLDKFVDSNQNTHPKTFANKFKKKFFDPDPIHKDTFQEKKERGYWSEILGALAREMTQVVADNYQDERRLDVNMIYSYLEDPGIRAPQDYVIRRVNGDWREAFIADNINDLIEIARQLGLDVYILIGKQHLETLSLRFEGEDIEVKAEKDALDLPEESMPTAKTIPADQKIASIQGDVMIGDHAMPTKTEDHLYGGIDFNAGALDLNVTGDAAVDIRFDPEKFEGVDIEGLVPVILNVAPVANFPMLLGLADPDEDTRPLDVDIGFDTINPADRKAKLPESEEADVS